jgi:hypothetical protein
MYRLGIVTSQAHTILLPPKRLEQDTFHVKESYIIRDGHPGPSWTRVLYQQTQGTTTQLVIYIDIILMGMRDKTTDAGRASGLSRRNAQVELSLSSQHRRPPTVAMTRARSNVSSSSAEAMA